ncbi:MAG: hypothetical protein K6C69_08465 [Lachnospiraceae bacterium]|nr:hypothetical protein [Lachnospiraceae bacterium]
MAKQTEWKFLTEDGYEHQVKLVNRNSISVDGIIQKLDKSVDGTTFEKIYEIKLNNGETVRLFRGVENALTYQNKNVETGEQYEKFIVQGWNSIFFAIYSICLFFLAGYFGAVLGIFASVFIIHVFCRSKWSMPKKIIISIVVTLAAILICCVISYFLRDIVLIIQGK